MADLDFVHLHVHSAYSLLEGALPIGKLAELAKADKQAALALTDTDNMFGVLEFSEKMASSGIQPIVGCALAIDFGDTDNGPRSALAASDRQRIVLLAASEDGYRSLMRLNSRAFMESPPNEPPRAKIEWLEDDHDGIATGLKTGIIALTGGPSGPLDRVIAAGQSQVAAARLDRLAALFGDRLYIELQRHGMAVERGVEKVLIDFAYERGIPLVATNEPFFASAADYESHDALICIAEGRYVSDGERRQLTPEHRYKSRAEMVAQFSDLPEAIASTVEIAQRCAFRPKTRKPILPRFSVGENGATADEATELRQQAEAGLTRRIETAGIAEGFTEKDYRDRLDFELNVIEKMKYPGYFLIVSDFIKWAKDHGIPVGPGRGSGAGSLVAYSLTITDLDPLRFGLLFERFLNPERVSMPDFDIDFCQDRREEVIRYVQERYGRDQVAQIITFGTLQARGVLRDVGRVLQMPYGHVDRLCKMVPQNPAAPISLAKAIEDEPKLQAEAESDPTVARAFAIARKLEGLTRHASTHAAGIVIGDRPLAELVPLYRDPKSDMPVTQFNMKWVEQAGLVKFDFLGLKTLTVLKTAVDLLKLRGIDIDLGAIPLDDKITYDLLARAEAVGVFQLESQGMRRALLDMKPDRFEDIIALVALYRPGPMANIPTYCARKHELEKPDYIHPKLEPVLKETFGVIVYQEQVMQAAQLLAGYSLGDADLLRRAMGKKIRSEMQKQGSIFVEGCAKNDIPKAQAEAIFELLERFADYGFNKSHAAAYALVAYQTAYMKANYPVEFLAASMTLDMGNTDKLSEFRAEAERLGIKVEPPSVNRSGVEFGVEGNTIIYALAALKGVGRQAVESIVEARGDKPFADLADFAARINPRAVNKRVLESLVQAGSFDEFDKHRARVFAVIDQIMGEAQRQHETAVSGAMEFSFGESNARPPLRMPSVEPWLPAERLKREYEAVGFFLSGHPLDDYAAVLKKMRVQSWAEFSRAVKNGQTAGKVAGTVVSRQERRTKTGNKMGIFGLSDASGAYEAVIFSEGLAEYRDLLEPGKAVLMVLSAEVQGDDVRARIQTAEPLDQAAANLQKGLRVFLREAAPLEGVAKRLEPAPPRASGAGEVSMILLLGQGREVEVKLEGRYKVSPQIAGAIKAVPGVVQVEAL
ncbi:DNA polymerase III subunit alpha [Undibacter mobilis]|uniref:DNA polymerase III subunit alpha n=1 Tax=Undibacter mobilis TaxID=2292256 RepID=A0A371B0Z5_9BRAD|nr:DNA polymerase III subunit alpha [Undibacter mobilis]RDV01249.1 DNA polymerase III subunit alpha [Undibacter mobilis]